MSDLARKTIRPGSLNSYSYYHSNRQSVVPAERQPASKPQNRNWLIFGVLALLVFGFIKGGHSLLQPSAANHQNTPVITAAQAPAVISPTDPCKGNVLPKLIKVSVSQRREWACQAGKLAHTNPVITGLRHDPATETPLGTYKIYAKQTNTTLKGTDSRGNWSDPVSYWMPFLDNQYGTYGFHDATWRNNSAFGKVSPDSGDASHGCVELPLNDSKWLYDWAQVGTTVNIES
jgi:hypothetical protein